MDIKELNVNINQANERNHPWEYARAKVVMNMLRKYLVNRNELHVADIGCGDIFFLEQFSHVYRNCRAVAVDTAFDADIIRTLSEKYRDLPVSYCTSMDEIDISGKRVDVVFLMDVIEHIEDDEAFLSELIHKPFVDDSTLFMITVPAFNNLYCSHDKWLGHYRRYDQKMLKELAKKLNLRIEEGGYFFTTLLLPRLFQKWIESHRKEEKEVTGIGGWTGGTLVSKLYEWALLADYYFFRFFRIFGIKFPGLSTYAICKRQS